MEFSPTLASAREILVELPALATQLATQAAHSKLWAKSLAATKATGSALVLWGEVALIVGGPPVRGWWRWQRGLGKQGLLLELGLVLSLVAAWQLRAWLRRKQFGRRLRRAFRGAQRSAKRRYSSLCGF